MRYYLEGKTSEGSKPYTVGGQRKKTKADINQWCEDNIKACGLDWRVGYILKFKNSQTVYTWRWIKDDSVVKFG